MLEHIMTTTTMNYQEMLDTSIKKITNLLSNIKENVND